MGPSEGNDDGAKDCEGTVLGEDSGDSVGSGTGVGAFVGAGAVGRFEIVGVFVIGTKGRRANVEGGKEGDLVWGGKEGGVICMGAEVVDVFAAEIVGDVVGLLSLSGIGMAVGMTGTDMTG